MSSRQRRILLLLSALGTVVLTMTLLAENAGPASANPLGAIGSIEPGDVHSCAVTTAGGVKCWGSNGAGQLGDGTLNSRPIPGDVSGLATGVASVDAAGNHSCALTIGGAVKCWGVTSLTPADVSGLSTGVQSIDVAAEYACAVKAGGLSCWGGAPSGSVPSGVAAVATGTAHICVLTTSGGVKCFGANEAGQLGDGTITDRVSPIDVTGLTSGVVAIGAGHQISCALMAGGGVKCWGAGFGVIPVDVPGVSNASALAVGGLHACALTLIGAVKCWGSNNAGELGDGQRCGLYCSVPVDVAGLPSGVVAISAGLLDSCVVTTGSNAYCWGDDNWGQLGDGNATGIRTQPTVVVQSAVKPTPTPTQCGGPCPTSTATNTPSPLIVPDFSIGVGAQCDSSVGPSVCTAAAGGKFTVEFRLRGIPAALSYVGYDAHLTYAGLTPIVTSPVKVGATVWPDCAFPVSSFDVSTRTVRFGCAGGIAAPPSKYTGVMARLDFQCPTTPGIGSVNLVHGDTETDVLDVYLVAHPEAPSGSESLTINCVAATATPQPVGGVSLDVPDGSASHGAGLSPWLIPLLFASAIGLAGSAVFAIRRAR